jgi:predicted ATPase/DNA-binding CsgD family transcriptional regulator/Tfp pilus assembly protein PilF
LPGNSKGPLLHHLPTQLSSFIGRVQDSGAVARLLAASRLVTLTGAGGCGKTRLATHVAHAIGERFTDGVWYSTLAPLSDPALVARTVATVLGLPEQPGRPLIDTLTEYLLPKQCLLVLDNCEHLIDACAHLATALLQACTQLRILATSREPLNVDGEYIWIVPSLSVPAAAGPVSHLQQFDAVRLFCERATAASSTFELTSQNGASVAHICRRLDGIPLAIELAAVRLKILSAEQIAARLDNAMRLLSEGKRGAPPRHQTLRATLDWSYTLLSAEEQSLCRRLSVFAGGFSLDAAETVCLVENERAEGLGRDNVVDLLSHLVDKSLVLVSLQSAFEQTARYRLLETVRQYGHERLRHAGELTTLQRNHTRYYLALAEVEWPGLVGVQQTDWLSQMQAEQDNLRAALAWSHSPEGDPALGLRLAAALCWFWWTHGHHSEAQQWLQRALATGPGSPTLARARALGWAGIFGVGSQGNVEQAAALLRESLALSQQLHDLGEMSWALVNLARVAEYEGDSAQAAQLAEQGVSLSRALGDPWYVAQALERLGETVRLQGDYAHARAIYEESLALSHAHGDKRNAATVLHNLGHVALQQGALQRAAAEFADSLALAQEISDERRIVMCLEGVAGVAARAGLLEQAASLFGAAQALRSRLGIPFEAADRVVYHQYATSVRARLGNTVSDTRWSEGEQMSQAEAMRYAQDHCSHLAESRPQSHRAATRLHRRRIRQEFGGLTTREREVVTLIVQGKTNREIANLLVISERTVDKHVGQILSKLGFRARAQVAAWAVEKGLGGTP